MNRKQTLFDRIVAIVVECCVNSSNDAIITAERILSEDKHESVCMSRCILANELRLMGLTTGTIAGHLGRSPQAVRNMINNAHPCHYSTNTLYREACREVSDRIEEEFGTGRK